MVEPEQGYWNEFRIGLDCEGKTATCKRWRTNPETGKHEHWIPTRKPILSILNSRKEDRQTSTVSGAEAFERYQEMDRYEPEGP